MHLEAQQLVEKLELKPHPEGGFYRETFRSQLELSGLRHGGIRNASTAIYFLLPAGNFSAFHIVKSDEIWHFYGGEVLVLHIISPSGDYEKVRLGPDVLSGEMPQAIVPAGYLQAAEQTGERYTLCGCTVAPGFDFADFEMQKRDDLISKFSQHQELFQRLTRN